MYQLVLACIFCLAVITMAFASEPENVYNIDKLHYSNLGAYTACVGLRWKDQEGKKHIQSLKCVDNVGGQQYRVPVNINDVTNVAEGDEVWLIIKIKAGDNESCRKDNTKFYFKKNVGKTAYFFTKGETLTNNRCRFSTVE